LFPESNLLQIAALAKTTKPQTVATDTRVAVDGTASFLRVVCRASSELFSSEQPVSNMPIQRVHHGECAKFTFTIGKDKLL